MTADPTGATPRVIARRLVVGVAVAIVGLSFLIATTLGVPRTWLGAIAAAAVFGIGSHLIARAALSDNRRSDEAAAVELARLLVAKFPDYERWDWLDVARVALAAPTGPESRRAGLSPAIRAELADVATDLEWAATKQDRPDVALGFRAAAGRVRERLEADEIPEPRRDAAVER